MNTFVAFFVLAVAAASASHIGLGHVAVGHVVHPAAHIASGSISVGPNGATVAGPAGSVSTDNGLHSGRAGARLAGPSGTVAGWGHHGIVEGPTGLSGTHGGDGWGAGHGSVGVVAPVAVAAVPVAAGWGHGGLGLGGLGHGAVIGHGIGHGIAHGIGHVVGHGVGVGHGW